MSRTAIYASFISRMKCPKDGSKIYATQKGEGVCESCSTVYIVALRPGFWSTKSMLVEKPQKVKEVVVTETKTIEKEVVKLRCDYCKAMNTLGVDKNCKNCGAVVR